MTTTAVLNLELDSKKYLFQLNQVESKTQKASKNFLTFGRVVTAVATGALVKFGLNAVKAFSVQEDALDDLGAALSKTGDDVDRLLPLFGSFASQLQKQTVFGDELILSQIAYAKNLGVTTDRLTEATTAAIGLSAKFRIDLKTAFNLIGRASKGQTQLLTRYGIVLKEGSTEQEKFNELLKIGADNFVLAEAQADRYSGRVKQLENSLGDINENIGEFLIKGLNADKIIKSLSDATFDLANNSHKASAIIESSFTNIFASIEKQYVKTKSLFDRGIAGIRGVISALKGDEGAAIGFALSGIASAEKAKKEIKDIEDFRVKRNKITFEKLAKEEEKKLKQTKKNTEAAIKSIVEETTGIPKLEQRKTDSKQDRTEQFAGAFEKGSTEAYRVEQAQKGNKTERDQLKVQKDIELNTRNQFVINETQIPN